MIPLRIKEIIVCFLSASTTFLVFFVWHKTVSLIIAGTFDKPLQFLLAVGGLLLAGLLFAVVAAFVSTGFFRYLSVLVGVGAPFLFLPPTRGVLIAMGVSVLLTVFAARRIRREYVLSIGFSAAKVFKGGIPLFFTVAGLLLSLFYFHGLREEKQALNVFLPRQAFDIAFRLISGSLQFIPGVNAFTLDTTVDQLLENIIRQQLQSSGVSGEQLPARELSKLLATQRDEIAARFGVKLGGGEKISDVLHATVTERLLDLLGPYRPYIAYASAVGFFLAFKSFTFFLYIVSLGAGFLLIKFLILGTILKKEKRTIEVERLTF